MRAKFLVRKKRAFASFADFQFHEARIAKKIGKINAWKIFAKMTFFVNRDNL